jgi:xylulokinase
MARTLAFDLGGSSLKLAIVDQTGAFLGQARVLLDIHSNGDHSYEVDPMDWWGAFKDGCRELANEGHDFADIDAVAGCGFTRTQVFLDEAGNIIRPAITFQDSRAAGVLDSIRAELSASGSVAIDKLGPFDPLARLLWLKQKEPLHWSRLRKIIEPKDFLNMRLTGIAASDAISQTPMTRALEASGEHILGILGIDPSILPDVHSPFDRLAYVQTGLPFPLSELAGKPVYCGSIDTWSCVLGSGGLKAGVGYSISGTSDVSGVICPVQKTAAGLLSVEWGPDLWQLGGPSQGAATRLQWAVDRFNPGMTLEDSLAAAFISDEPAPLFLPFLDGERTPLWDPNLQGAFLGLSTSHTAMDFLRSVAEGINYLAREVLVRAEGASGTAVSHVCFSGGLAKSAKLCQLKADVLNRDVLVPKNPETGLAGAARITSRYGTRDQVPVCERATLYSPDPAKRLYHDDRFSVFRFASEAITPISHKLSGLSSAN